MPSSNLNCQEGSLVIVATLWHIWNLRNRHFWSSSSDWFIKWVIYTCAEGVFGRYFERNNSWKSHKVFWCYKKHLEGHFPIEKHRFQNFAVHFSCSSNQYSKIQLITSKIQFPNYMKVSKECLLVCYWDLSFSLTHFDQTFATHY